MTSFAVAGTHPAATVGMPDTSRLAVGPGVSAPSQLGSSIRIDGEIYAEHDLFVDGEVNGNVIVPNHKISIGPNANVKASVKAKNVVVVGTLEGNIDASERIELRSKSNLVETCAVPVSRLSMGPSSKVPLKSSDKRQLARSRSSGPRRMEKDLAGALRLNWGLNMFHRHLS